MHPGCACVCVFRLNVGALFILWLQIGQGPGGPQVHRAVHSALQGLIAADVSVKGSGSRAVITSVSTAGTTELEASARSRAEALNKYSRRKWRRGKF